MKADTLEDATRASQRHFAADGVPELVAGGFVLLWGLTLVADQVWPKETWPLRLSNGVALFGPLLAALFLIVPNPLLRRLKERITYPRIGYVKPRPVPASRQGSAVGGAILVALVWLAWWMGARGGRGELEQLMPLMMGALAAVPALTEALRLRLRRFLIYAGVALAAGGLASWLCLPGPGSALVICAVGAATVAGGAWTLRRLLRLPPEAEA